MDRRQLAQLVDERKSTREIAQHLSCSQTNIRYWLRQYGLKTAPHKLHHCACGETDPTKFYGHKHRTCGKCHNEYTKQKGREKRLFAIHHLGGRCVVCDYDKHTCSLDIHHVNPSNKDPNFETMRGWSKTRILEELQHCILLCKNCHAAVHADEIQLTVG